MELNETNDGVVHLGPYDVIVLFILGGRESKGWLGEVTSPRPSTHLNTGRSGGQPLHSVGIGEDGDDS